MIKVSQPKLNDIENTLYRLWTNRQERSAFLEKDSQVVDDLAKSIDDKGVKQPIYETYRRFYRQAHAYVVDFSKSHGRPPSSEEYAKAVVEFLK